jgi:hypothetical protein
MRNKIDVTWLEQNHIGMLDIESELRSTNLRQEPFKNSSTVVSLQYQSATIQCSARMFALRQISALCTITSTCCVRRPPTVGYKGFSSARGNQNHKPQYQKKT